jgi:transcriptional regulator with PAS, ATPase and Fis domain
MIHRVAGFSSNVMVFGETGTGKEVVSKAIHKLSGRKGNFVAVNCGNIPKELLCSEFFGYERGAFTGARAEGAMGKFEYANNGTLLLDEISEMPLDMQVSLLRFIQERSITKINSNVTKELDVRIIAATNKNICDLVSQGLFREDLYYRLAVIELELPPLNERGEDVILLAEHFIRELSSQLNIGVKTLDRCAKDVLLSHYWPGNIRELRNYIEKIMILSLDDVITADILARYGMIHEGELHPQTVKGKNDKLDSIRRCLEKHKGNIAQTAKELGMARNTLYRKIDKYNIHIQTSVVKHAN